jgi:hypothetical protein
MTTVFGAVVTSVIAIVGAVISYLQWRTAVGPSCCSSVS